MFRTVANFLRGDRVTPDTLPSSTVAANPFGDAPTAKLPPLESQVDEVIASFDEVRTFDVSQSGALGRNGGTRYNPDDLVGKQGLHVYSRMMTDEQVGSASEFQLAAIMAPGWELVFPEGSKLDPDEQKARISTMTTIIDRMTGSFDDAIEGIASGFEYGFSISEKVFTNIMIDGQMKVGINAIMVRNPATFYPVFDSHGVLKKIQQRAGGMVVDVDDETIIRYVHKPQWDQFYGRSDLRRAYRWWYIKDQVSRLWPMYVEKFGGGIAVAKRLDDSAPTAGSPEYASLINALSNMRSLGAIILPRGVDMNLAFPQSSDVYENCIKFCDLAMAKARLMPNLMGQSHTGQTGAYSQSVTQFEGYLWVVKRNSGRIEDVLNSQLFECLGVANWHDGEYPRFRFKPASFEHLKWMLETWTALITAGTVIPSEEDEQYLRKLLEMPEREPNEVLKNPNAPPQLDPNAKAPADPQAPPQDKQDSATAAELARISSKLDEMLRVKQPIHIIEREAAAPTAQRTQEPKAHKHHQATHGGLLGLPREVFDRASERVAFGMIATRTDALAEASVTKLATMIAESVRRTLGTDQHLAEVLSGDNPDVSGVQLDDVSKGRLRRTYADILTKAWTVGGQMAANEIERASATKGKTIARSGKFASLRDKAATYFDSQSFRMAGDTSDQTKRIIQQQLQNGIKFGTPLSDVRADIWDSLVSKGLTDKQSVRGVETDAAVNGALDALWQDSEDSAAAYLNTLVRTNTFEALNEARFAEFTDPELSDFVVALRYAAVLDSSTTEICTALNDSTWSSDSPEWDTYRPPNHYNCRSVLIPITAVDGWDGEESPEPDVQPQEGFA